MVFDGVRVPRERERRTTFQQAMDGGEIIGLVLAGTGIDERDKGDVVGQHHQLVFGDVLQEVFQPGQLRLIDETVVGRAASGIDREIDIVQCDKNHPFPFERIISGAKEAAPGIGGISVAIRIQIDVVIPDHSELRRTHSTAKAEQPRQQIEVIADQIPDIEQQIRTASFEFHQIEQGAVAQVAEFGVRVGLAVPDHRRPEAAVAGGRDQGEIDRARRIPCRRQPAVAERPRGSGGLVGVGKLRNVALVGRKLPAGRLHHAQIHIIAQGKHVASLRIGSDHRQSVRHQHVRDSGFIRLVAAVPIEIVKNHTPDLRRLRRAVEHFRTRDPGLRCQAAGA